MRVTRAAIVAVPAAACALVGCLSGAPIVAGAESAASQAYGPPLHAASTCTWSRSVDAIVVGTVLDVRFADAPAIENVAGVGWAWTDACARPGAVTNPALHVEVAVEGTLVGALPAVVWILVGSDRTSTLHPWPFRDEDGQVRWVGDGPRIEVGSRVGAALHYVAAHDVWSVWGETPFVVDADGDVAFLGRDGSSMLEPPPHDAPGTIGGLAAAIDACAADVDDPEAAARRERMRASWGPFGRAPPTRFLAAYCFRDAPIERPCGCHATCGDGEMCRAGHCIACGYGPCPRKAPSECGS